MKKRSYKRLDKLLHQIQDIAWDVQSDRKEHDKNHEIFDKKMKKHLDDLVECRQEIFRIVEEMNGDDKG
jgi:hypothetical protein